MLGRRRRRRANIKPISGQCIVFAEFFMEKAWKLYLIVLFHILRVCRPNINMVTPSGNYKTYSLL